MPVENISLKQYTKHRDALCKIFDDLAEKSRNCEPDLLPDYANVMCKLFKLLYLD